MLNRDITMPTGGFLAGGGYGTATNGERVGGAPITIGTIIQLPNIYYNFNDTELRSDALSDLDLVVKMLKMYPEMTIEIASHTDARGSESYNQQLSEKRSQKAVDYIISQGIGVGRAEAVGYGETKPRNRCVNGVKCPDNQHQENRRTEVVIKNLGASFSATQQDPEAIKKTF
ncbi:MAG: OmpA family protein [Saprospiraceae bacterium]|nr:OmpA family protein [Saprospiraceae bacterium]